VLRGPWDQREVLHRDRAAEADAADALWASGLRPLPSQAFQWRAPEAAEGHEHLWSLAEEAMFSAFWADQVPRLQGLGWLIVVRPGFAHQSLPVDRWRLVVEPHTGAEQGLEPDLQGVQRRPLAALHQPRRQGSWLLSLGVEVAGETLDLAPMLAELLKHDKRWLSAAEIAAIDDDAVIQLRAPGGRCIEAPAAPLKAIVGAMVDLLTDPHRAGNAGPIVVSVWETERLEALRLALAADPSPSAAQRAGAHGRWALQGEAGLAALAERLRVAGSPPPVAPPAGLGLTLRPYQRQGLAWLQYLREQQLAGILADDMGLGKTAQVLAHLLVEHHAGRLDRPALVVLPTSLIANWLTEAARVAPVLRVLTLQGASRARDFARLADHDVVFTTQSTELNPHPL
jgi:SNF2-related domain